MKKDWSVFSFWNERYKEVPELAGPFQDEPISDKTIFLWSQMTASLPSGGSAGAWDYFPEPKALVAYLRFRMLPAYFEIWLVREEWDPKSDEFISADELFSRAMSSNKCRYAEDVPLMTSLIQQLDNLLRQDEDASILSGLQQVIEAFNNKWEDTGTWQFSIGMFADPVSVGQEIYRRRTEGEDDGPELFEEEFAVNKAEWLEICAHAASGPEAQERFIQVLREDYVA